MTQHSTDALEKAIVNYRVKCDIYWDDREQGVSSQEEYEQAIEKELESVMALIHQKELEAERRTEKAFGGCKKCYGKGYSTVRDGVIGYNDFGGEGFKSPVTTKMRFCACERGKQLAQLNKEREGM